MIPLFTDTNPCVIVTNLSQGFCKPRHLYEKTYIARGEMKNRIKGQQLNLFAKRTNA